MNAAPDITAPMNAAERRASIGLAGVFATRMLGLFMILPVFSLAAEELAGSTPLLIGVAISIYGLTQALLQIPFGMLSDHFGRKGVILAGLSIFILGSVVAAYSSSIYGVIIGRALQGGGAIAAAVMALAADLTREVHRTKAMAMIGISIGISFAISIVCGPVVASIWGLKGIFLITAGLAVGGMLVLVLVVPNPASRRFHRDTQPVPAQFKTVLGNSDLVRLDFGIFALHLILMASFVVLPLVLRDAGLVSAEHWKVYLPVMLLAMAACVPFIILGEKKQKMKWVFIGAVAAILVANLGLWSLQLNLLTVCFWVWLFFSGFNLLEAVLPSMISKTAPADLKGTAMGVYSTSQFLGAFVGGISGGWVYGEYGAVYVFGFCASVAIVWLVVIAGMNPPRYFSSLLLHVGEIADYDASMMSNEMRKVTGVAEAVVVAGDGVAYLKVDKRILDQEGLYNLVSSRSR